MIILYSKNINYNFTNILKYYDQNNYYANLKCPNCHSQNLIKWGSYNRTLYYLEDNIIKTKIINISRVRCKDCHKTHALLPCFIVPYKLYALDIILNSLSNDNSTLSINYDTFTKWNKQFNKFIPYLRTMINKYTKIEIVKLLKQDILNYYRQYFNINNKILMMVRPGIYDMSPF